MCFCIRVTIPPRISVAFQSWIVSVCQWLCLVHNANLAVRDPKSQVGRVKSLHSNAKFEQHRLKPVLGLPLPVKVTVRRDQFPCGNVIGHVVLAPCLRNPPYKVSAFSSPPCRVLCGGRKDLLCSSVSEAGQSKPLLRLRLISLHGEKISSFGLAWTEFPLFAVFRR